MQYRPQVCNDALRGGGRYFNRAAIQTILGIAAANGFGRAAPTLPT